MRVGVTGATGFIGQYLIRDYSHKYDFIIPVRDESKVSSCMAGAEFIKSDYSVDSLCEAFDGCDAIVHLASTGMPKVKRELRIEEYFPNIELTGVVLQSCKELGINRVVYTSSKSVYSKNESVHRERECTKPFDEYGVSKASSEMIIDFYARIYGISVTILRMPEVAGIDLTRGMLNPFWNTLLKKSVHKEMIPIYGRGEATRELIYVKDVIKAIELALRRDLYGVFNISTGYLVKNMDIARAFCSTFSNDDNYRLYPEKEEWGTRDILAVDKALVELGFKPDYGLLEMVEDIKKEYESNQF